MAQPHRGLPPPAAMTLPTSSSPSSAFPPHLWQTNSEETLRELIQVSAEHARQKTEAERTKQEELRLQTRQTELSILREAIQAGMTGPDVAVLFVSSRGLASDWVHDYLADFRQQQRAPPPPPSDARPELRRETRLIGQVHSSAPHHSQPMGPPATGPAWETHQPGFSGYHAPRGSTGRSSQSGQPQSGPPPPPQGQPHRSSLPRIHTGEISGQKPSQLSGPNPILNPSPMPQPSSTSDPTAATQSPGIYFHHWQPPSTQVSGQTPVQRASSPHRQLGSPFPHHHPPSHLSGSEVSSSPKRRKTTSGQPYSPPYPSAPGHGSNVTPARRRAHSRQRSDTTAAGIRSFEPYHRPTTRQRRADTVSGHSDEHPVGSVAPEPMQTSPDSGSGPQQQGSVTEQGGLPLAPPPQHPQQRPQHLQHPQHPPPPPPPPAPPPPPPPPPPQQQQQQQPPSRPYSPGPDRARDLPYSGQPGSEGGQPVQGGNGRH